MLTELLVISGFPPEGTLDHPTVIGGASYTKKILLACANYWQKNNKHIKITVLAAKIPTEQHGYTEQNITVKRTWQRNNLFTFLGLTKEIILHHRRTKTVLLQLELSSFGGGLLLVQVPVFVAVLKLLRKRVIINFHEIITDSSVMAGHIGIKAGSFRSRLLNYGLRYVYTSLLTLVDRAIVFDPVLKKRLQTFGNTDRVAVIPIAVETAAQTQTKTVAKKRLHIPEQTFVVLTFGFLAWHKGTDWVVQAVKELPAADKKHFQLILAGGPNPNHVNKPVYKTYLHALEKSLATEPITLTGFLPNEQLSDYFTASDLVVFPYRSLVSSSASLAQALAFAKPFLLADTLRETLSSPDMKVSLAAHHLTTDDVVFPLSHEGFAHTIKTLRQHPDRLTQLAAFSADIRNKRSWEDITNHYQAIVLSD